ncbi:MAG: selenide, water dikinase SelD [Richelia sp. RM2_1_2]|nr:selenide, water dikinase SelD [Richelia sp. SM1_7_0]NJN07661.1 selenide, water dikinase SelD [Richelia sp. RM1_1_1]NJO29486.1 selenide, water dikinase SelD [Richelia sp. SL_2_1]NJO60998.1 selenide, water dikinase SelD [Richelia sp. RM2_1_2]
MQQNIQPLFKDLVLVGGGHSHVVALKIFAMNALPGVRITLISDYSHTPYSGMLPGHIAGFYTHDECHIDLRKLANFAQAQLYIDSVIGIDLQKNQLICANRPHVSFDLLSIDIGSTPATISVPGATEYAIPAKPVGKLLENWYELAEEIQHNPQKSVNIGIVGGGAGGVELALSMWGNLRRYHPTNLQIHLFSRNNRNLLSDHHGCVGNWLRRLLIQRDVKLHLGETVCQVAPPEDIERFNVVCESGLEVECNYIFWVTQASAPQWLAATGITTDERGFILVNDNLQSVSHPQVFAAGDIATMKNHPRPKAGVFAVHQGKPLFENLRRSLLGKALKNYQPQQDYLSLIGTGDGMAIATRGWLTLPPHKLLWLWKDYIDRQFMKRFSDLPEMGHWAWGMGNRVLATTREQDAPTTNDFITPHSSLLTPNLLRCSGCGSKVGGNVLEGVLQRVEELQPIQEREDIIIGLKYADDAAVVKIPTGKVMVQTIDYFTSLINDSYIFGQITVNHCLSDIFAMGAIPQTALALATIPYGTSSTIEETLFQLLSGAVKQLNQAGVSLVGGHTIQGNQLAFGLSCNGLADQNQLLRKSGMQEEQVLILTKAVGTGTLFAAQMRREVKGVWIDKAIKSMLLSNQAASGCFLEYGATACTDITGFGLIGHLLEMVKASQIGVTLKFDNIPILDGARETVEKRIFSSLYPENLKAASYIKNLEEWVFHPNYPLLYDPQTSGGLLAAVSREQADSCLRKLKELGYEQARIIGKVVEEEGIRLV